MQGRTSYTTLSAVVGISPKDPAHRPQSPAPLLGPGPWSRFHGHRAHGPQRPAPHQACMGCCHPPQPWCTGTRGLHPLVCQHASLCKLDPDSRGAVLQSDSTMEVENGHAAAAGTENGAAAAAPAPEPPAEVLPEVEAYAYLLALMYLLDRKQAEEVRGLFQ